MSSNNNGRGTSHRLISTAMFSSFAFVAACEVGPEVHDPEQEAVDMGISIAEQLGSSEEVPYVSCDDCHAECVRWCEDLPEGQRGSCTTNCTQGCFFGGCS